jgi:hypothetical protein
MKRIAFLAGAIAMMASASVFSQAQGDKPAAAPVKEEAKPAAAQKEINLVQGPGQAAVKEDARHCLEHADNTDIIKCAEPYLPSKK